MLNLTHYKIKEIIKASGFSSYEVLYRFYNSFDKRVTWFHFEKPKIFNTLDEAMAEACFLQDDRILTIKDVGY